MAGSPTFFATLSSRENSTFQRSPTRGIVCLLTAAQCPFFFCGPLLICLPPLFRRPQEEETPTKGLLEPSEVTRVLSPQREPDFNAAVFSRFHHRLTYLGGQRLDCYRRSCAVRCHAAHGGQDKILNEIPVCMHRPSVHFGMRA